MTISLPVETEAERRVADHVLVLLRGLRLSRDLDLAIAAVRVERELTEGMKASGNGKEEPAHV